MTNAQGEYTLRTRHNKKGAAVGKHTVSFEFEDPNDMEGLQDDLEEAKGQDGSAVDVAAVNKRIAAFQQLQKGCKDYRRIYPLRGSASRWNENGRFRTARITKKEDKCVSTMLEPFLPLVAGLLFCRNIVAGLLVVGLQFASQSRP